MLQRAIFPSGSKGLMLHPADTEEGKRIRARAIETGFKEIPGYTAVAYKPPSPSYFRADRLASLFGGETVDIPRDELETYPLTIDYTRPGSGKGAARAETSPAAGHEEIGRNFRGNRVFRAVSGERLERVVDGEGRSKFISETESSNPEAFLRASGAASYPQLAAGLLQMADRGAIGSDALKSVAKAACEPFAESDDSLNPVAAAKALRAELLRQIVGIVVEDSGSRENYHRAMRCAENAAGALRESVGRAGGLSPTAGFLVFLRRLTRTADEMEFTGNDVLATAAPALRSKGKAKRQLFDLTTADAGGAAERAANALAGRDKAGNSILLVAGAGDSDTAAATRNAVGRVYALEAVAEISQEVVFGAHDGEPVTVFIVGERRPEPEDSLPQAATRTFQVAAPADLDALHTELLRSRRRIADWHLGLLEHDVAEDQAENERQRPYVPLSQATPPVTMIPKALEGATAKALRRAAEELRQEGGVDRFVANALGMQPGLLGSVLTSEQVDAIAMGAVAARRGRGFLLADQTGIGKGRSLAAMARRQLRNGGNVLYFTENADINIPDVWRDFVAVGADAEARPCIMVSRSVQLEAPNAVREGGEIPVYRTESAATRRRIYESGLWPEGRNLVITNYSQFNGRESPSRNWAVQAPDENTLLILDESHNAINQRSNTGRAIRSIIELVGHANAVFATATPMRNPTGANLYKPLLPDGEAGRPDHVLDNLTAGGETAQECFTTMLAEDGVFLRRDHNLSNIEFQVRLPDDSGMARYQELMNRFSPLCELMLDAALKVGLLIGRSQEMHFQRMIQDGVDERTARAQTNLLYQHSAAAGGPLARLARLTINAVKVDQVVEQTLNEIREGRKPQITFHSTNAGLFNELATAGGPETEIPLSLRHQIERVARRIFLVRIDDDERDARELDPEVAELSVRIFDRIAALPDELPVSPVDAVIEALEGNSLTVGEVSGRSLAYRSGRIVRRQGADRKDTVSAYNDGRIDVLIFNMAGATGGSYHASPEFRDQRPRSLVEMETPIDIIKYIQAQGRGNRYGQVARPRIVSVMTGLIPEMRILQQRNRKLRSMGASIDGNRAHPLLVDDVPDFLNKVGDMAVRQVLRTNGDLARRLGLAEFARDNVTEDEAFGARTVTDSGAASASASSLANRALSRSLALTALEQTELVEFIRMEFAAIIEELESRNANPLRPRELLGEIDIKTTTLFSGIESDHDRPDYSAFYAPLFMSTGIHHYTEDPISGDELLQMVNQEKELGGADGFSRFADKVESKIPTAVSHLIRPGGTIADAIEEPDRQPQNFRLRLRRLKRLAELLKNMKPGRVLQIDDDDGSQDRRLRTIVKLIYPRLDRFVLLPQAYKVRTVTPGHSQYEIVSLGQLVNLESHRIRILQGLDLGHNEMHLRTFSQQSERERKYPVQVLSGNLLEAISTARSHRLGTMSLFRSTSGQVQRGIVITGSNVRLEYLPAVIPSSQAASALLARVMNGQLYGRTVIWAEDGNKPHFQISVYSSRSEGEKRVVFTAFSAAAKELTRGLTNGRRNLVLPPDAALLDGILSALGGFQMCTHGDKRAFVNDVVRQLNEGELPEELRLV